MSKYECQQCKETSEGPFPGGKCSKCGSLNIRNTDRKFTRKQKPEERGKKTFLMTLLWIYILYELWKRLG